MIACGIERQRAEGAHGVDQQALAVFLRQRADLGDRIEDAARRLAMDREDMGDRGVALQQRLDRGEIGRRVLRRLVHDGRAPRDVEDPLRALAVGAVDQQQHLAAGGTKVVSMASTAKVPEPCIGTVT